MKSYFDYKKRITNLMNMKLFLILQVVPSILQSFIIKGQQQLDLTIPIQLHQINFSSII
ncbi:hypothetical protein pb186bvf_000829 [Paramecium bursaria]